MQKKAIILALFSLLVAILLVTIYLYKLQQVYLSQIIDKNFKIEECWFSVPVDKSVYCGYFLLEEDVKIPLVIVRRSLISTDFKPLLYIGGGPGIPTITYDGSISYWLKWIDDLNVEKDLVLFDYLGTGYSEPKLECSSTSTGVGQQSVLSISVEEEFRRHYNFAKNCFEEVASNKNVLERYSLRFSVKIIKTLIEKLNDVDWDIYAISYGTHVALSLLQESPANVKKIVLDGAYPLDVNVYDNLPKLIDSSLRKMFLGCKLQLDCKESFHNLEEKFYDFVNQLEIDPKIITISRPDTKENIEVLLDGKRLIRIIYESMKDWQIIQELPIRLWAAIHGKLDALEPMILEYSKLYFNPHFNSVVYNSNECEERKRLKGKLVSKIGNEYAQVFRDISHLQHEFDVCNVWSVSTSNVTEHRSKKIDVPALIFVGSYDPVTPVGWARQAKNKFNDAKLFEFSGIGHDVLSNDSCALLLLQKFINKGDVTGVEDCNTLSNSPEFVTMKTR